jgi:hypothetical protein
MPGIYDILMGEAPDAAQSAEALARAIRGQRGMAALGGMAGGGMPGLGTVNAGQALQDQQQLEKAAEARMRYGQEAQNFKQTMASQAQQAKSHDDLMKAQLGLQGKMYASDSAFQRALATNDKEDKQAVRDDSAWERYVKSTNAGLATSRSVIGQDKNVMQRVDRTLGLVESKEYLTPQEVHDMYVALAGVLTGGNVAARGTIESISASSLNMKLADAMQWISSNPEDAGAQEFVKRTAATLRVERDLAKKRIIETVKDQATGMQELLRRKGRTAIDYHREVGVDDATLESLGLDVKGHPAKAPANSAAGVPEFDWVGGKLVPRK